MKKILISLSVIAAAAAIVIGGTTAFFSDTETSSGNTFTAGAIDLTVDSTASYNGVPVGTATWSATDLGVEHKFFDFRDIKPGDFGENTISLHVNNNDAWLRMLINTVTNDDNYLTEPEGEIDTTGGDIDGKGDGELGQNLLFSVWLDQGVTPGFQGPQDLSECDNDYVEPFEPMIISEGTINEDGEIWDLKDYNGLYLEGGKTACFGINWKLPFETSNEVQTDSMSATVEFQVEQYRNNLTPFGY